MNRGESQAERQRPPRLARDSAAAIGLLSVVEEKCFAPAINLTVFPNTPSESYWSGSPYASGNLAWSIDLTDGGSSGSAKWFANYVRLVRDGQ